MNSMPSPGPASQKPVPELQPRLWVKVVLFLLVCGLLIGGVGRMGNSGVGNPSHSVSGAPSTNAVIEGALIDVAPDGISGRIAKVLVNENERVEAGQVLAELDAAPFVQQVELAKARLASAEAEWKREEAALARIKIERPLHTAIAEQALAVARAGKAKADEALKLTEIEVARAVEEAKAGVDAARIVREFSKKDADRYASLSAEDTLLLRKPQEAAQALAIADANLKLASARLATAEALRSRAAVARRAVEEAEAGVSKVTKDLELDKSGAKEQLSEAELTAAARRLAVDAAKQALTLVEGALGFTKVRAPVAGVVLRRLRTPGEVIAPGAPVVTLYQPDSLFVSVPVDPTRLEGINPGNKTRIDVPAFEKPFHGRVFSVNHEQRTPVRVLFEKDERLLQLRPGTPVKAEIERGKADVRWVAEQATRKQP